MAERDFPPVFNIYTGQKILDLRYGENPHQQAAFYKIPGTYSPLQNLERLAGRELSLVNLTDIDAGISVARLFPDDHAAVVIKHNSPCGIALGDTSEEASSRAIEADPVSAFGGVLVLNEHMDLAAAEVIGRFRKGYNSGMDIIAVPSIDEDALARVKRAGSGTGVYTFGVLPTQFAETKIKMLEGGFIIQTDDLEELSELTYEDWTLPTIVKANTLQLEQMLLGWKFASRIRSNTVLVMDPMLPMTRGIGSGQTNRVGSTEIALKQAKAAGRVEGAILVSDSFFPFADSVRLAAKYKIGAIVQQGGSNRDQLSIDAANKAGIPMVFTGRRAFWH